MMRLQLPAALLRLRRPYSVGDQLSDDRPDVARTPMDAAGLISPGPSANIAL